MKDKRETEDVLTLSEAAAFLKVSVRTLVFDADLRRVPARRVGCRWRFSRKALEDFLRGGATDSQYILPDSTRPDKTRFF